MKKNWDEIERCLKELRELIKEAENCDKMDSSEVAFYSAMIEVSVDEIREHFRK